MKSHEKAVLKRTITICITQFCTQVVNDKLRSATQHAHARYTTNIGRILEQTYYSYKRRIHIRKKAQIPSVYCLEILKAQSNSHQYTRVDDFSMFDLEIAVTLTWTSTNRQTDRVTALTLFNLRQDRYR